MRINLNSYFWLGTSTPDAQSKRTLYWHGLRKTRHKRLLSWRYGEKRWLEEILASFNVYPEC